MSDNMEIKTGQIWRNVHGEVEIDLFNAGIVYFTQGAGRRGEAMTDEQIRKLRELEAKATPGPWESMDGPNVGIIKDATERAVAMTIWMLRDFPGIAVPDAAFISAARNALPELLDEVERLESENAALRERVAVLEEVRKAAVVVAEDEIGEPGGNPFVCYFCGCHSPSSMAPWRHRDGCPMSALRAALDGVKP